MRRCMHEHATKRARCKHGHDSHADMWTVCCIGDTCCMHARFHRRRPQLGAILVHIDALTSCMSGAVRSSTTETEANPSHGQQESAGSVVMNVDKGALPVPAHA